MDRDRKNSTSSTVFRIGTVSLVFLAIGYQTALFINRAAILGIEARRDRPDTVFVVRTETVAEDIGEGDSGTENRRTGSGIDASDGGRNSVAGRKVSVRYDTVRRNAVHSAAVEEVRERTRRVENFRFDPNTVSVDDLQRLGFSRRQAQAIDNYRLKGGRFRRREDFAKSFVVADSVYRRLEAYIDIPLLDINSADSAAFDTLPGIGPYFAARMVEYRTRLGGYSYTEQLTDIYNFGQERFDALRDLVCCSPPEPYPLWTLPSDSLRLHPYIGGYREAEAIVLLRENYPADSLSVGLIRRAGILPEEDLARLERCLIAEP
ncbi:MAG: hypothetical protein BHV78_06335 [Bacteroides sp. CAG:1060_57_27]|nr:MAG: hypothetical protein BHV78_06335 [Bacteroides sp. CAG:1060_57_27]